MPRTRERATTSRSRLGIGLACAIVLVPAAARARTVAVVLVPHRPFAGPAEADRVRLAVVRAARASGWEVPAGDPIDRALAGTSGDVPASELGWTGNVRRLHDEADEALRSVDFAAARAKLEDAEALLRRHLDLPLVVPWLAETAARRAIVEWAAGDAAAARAAIDRVLSLDPGRRLTTDEAHPDLVALLEAVRREREARPHVTVSIGTGSVTGARVVLDDEVVGRSPASALVAPGRHVIRAEAPGYAVGVTEVEVGAEGSPPIDLHLEESADAHRFRDLPADLFRPGRPVTATVAQVASASGADVALVGLVTEHRGTLGVVLQAVGPDGAGSRLAVPIEGVDEAVGALLSADPGRRAVALSSHEWIAAPDPDAPVPRDRAFWQRWYFWAAVGVGAIGGAALTYGLAQPEAEPRFVTDDHGVD